jgi:hypothetical protein
MKDRDWRRLLELMKEGTVVPVVGSRLLVDADGTSPLTDRVARRLLADYDMDIGDQSLPAFRELSDVATRLKGKLRNPQDLYGDVDSALKLVGLLEDGDRAKGPGGEGVAIPKPLQQLAQIGDFRAMVTLTPDDLLARALKSVRRTVHEVVHSPRLPTSEVDDLQVVDLADLRRRSGPVELLYLFGKSRPTPLFAIHEEDLLEYAHNIIAGGSHAPKKFIGVLQECSLLLIGCNFPDWLSRFILRATRKVRLADSGGRREWLVERLGQEDPFVGFLGQYSPETEVLTGVEPAQFVSELFERWSAQNPQGLDRAAAPVVEPPTVRDNTLFFISYSRTTDQEAARALHRALISIGVAENQIWFDTQALEPGDKYTRGILDGIRSSRYFLPLVSRAATERERAFVFREWSEATEQDLEMNRTYLVPLVVDAEYRPESYREESVSTWLERKIDFGHAPGGLPDQRTLRTLTSLLREARSRG